MITLILDANTRLLPRPRRCGFSGGELIDAVSQVIELHADLGEGRFGDVYPGFNAQQCAIVKRTIACVSASAPGDVRVWACEDETEIVAKVAELIDAHHVHQDDAHHVSTRWYRVDHMDERERKAWAAANPL